MRPTLGSGLAVASALFCFCVLVPRVGRAEVTLVDEKGGWRLSLDGRVNAFFSLATGTGLPNEPDFLGAGTNDTKNANDGLHSSRFRNGFMMDILGFTGKREINPDFLITTRIALWMNITGSRTKNIPGEVDPRELYGKIEGRWGSILAGSDLALFARGGILVDARIAHDFGLGYPCSIRNASGGACGMTAFGAPFPGFEPGLVYATPELAGLQLSLGAYDPATVGNAQLNRAPLPRFEAEAKFDYEESVRLFVSGFWQVLEGTVNATAPATGLRDLQADSWGVQAGGMLSVGPIMVGGAAFQGAGFSPIGYVEESQIVADSSGTLRESRGAFGLGAVLIDPLRLKVAGGMGVWRLDKNENDSGPISDTGTPNDPQLIRENLGVTVGVYQTTEPVTFALEYFRAQHTWYDRGEANAIDPTMIDVVTPKQVVHFFNAGMTIVW